MSAIVPDGLVRGPWEGERDGDGSPGATALYWVYVVLTTLNKKGSNTVAVTRPG
jgi:hypothetical protein